MVRKFLSNRTLALLAAVVCSLSASAHGGRYTRQVAALRDDLAAVRAENDQLRSDVAAALLLIRSYPPPPPDDGGGDGGRTAPAAPAEIVGGRSMIAQGRPGFSVGSAWWVVGMETPWGRLERAFPGGCLIDGRRYVYRQELPNEL